MPATGISAWFSLPIDITFTLRCPTEICDELSIIGLSGFDTPAVTLSALKPQLELE
jgi:hypothetical protein